MEIKDVYEKHKNMIAKFLKHAKRRDNTHLMAELMFCIQTPQSKAKYARETIEKLKSKNKLFNAEETEIREVMYGVRFANRKSKYISESKHKLPEIKKRLDMPPQELREWLVKNVKGLGMKEASHYLRNIGIFGLAILDVHVQNFMKKHGMLNGEVGKLSKKQYLDTEKNYFELAKKIGIRPEELDIVIWLYGNKGETFYG
jgi:N-glycosylase/DNA lyase